MLVKQVEDASSDTLFNKSHPMKVERMSIGNTKRARDRNLDDFVLRQNIDRTCRKKSLGSDISF